MSTITSGLKNHTDCWAWISGQALCYKNWLPGEPNQEPDTEDCGVIRGMKGSWGWNDLSCDIQHQTLCER